MGFKYITEKELARARGEDKMKKKEMPECPKCKSNEKVICTEGQHVVFKLFIAKPLDTHFCMKCKEGFFLKEGD
jgi:hypothetical protein